MEGDCNAYTLITVSAPFMRIDMTYNHITVKPIIKNKTIYSFCFVLCFVLFCFVLFLFLHQHFLVTVGY